MATSNEVPDMTYDNLPLLTIQQLCNANHGALKGIMMSAPHPIRQEHHPLSRAMYKLLSIVLTLRETIINSVDQVSNVPNPIDDKENMDRLMGMEFDEIEHLASENLTELVSMVKASLRVEESLEPRQCDDSNSAAVVALVLKWHLKATRAPLERRDLDQENANPITAQAVEDELPSRSKRVNPLADSHSTDLNLKKQKVLRVAGVPTFENDEAQDFWVGLGGAAPIRPSQLKAYSGRTTILLNVQEFMGPSILHSFCQEGVSIELVVRNIRGPRQQDGRLYNSETEALTLARIMHFHLCRYQTMEEALVSNPWTEIALRRLWAIVEVQSLTSGPTPLTREEAWQQVLPSLEVYPDVGIRVPAMRSLVHRQVSAA